MTKDIKDYLHYYIGCDAAINYDRKSQVGMLIDKITGVSLIGVTTSNGYLENLEDVKPILRPLSSMTDEEKEIVNSEWGNPVDTYLTDALSEGNKKYVKLLFESFELFHHLLQKGFDLFGLIESGLAIDATTLNKSK